MNKQPYRSVSLKSLIVAGTILTLSNLRENVNGYPFVTALDKDGNANNLYLSKTSASTILAENEIGDSILAKLVNAEIAQTENIADGATRFKIVLSGQSNYASKAEMNALFGLEEEVPVDFDMDVFVKGFEREEMAENDQDPLKNSTPRTKATLG